MTAKSCVQKHSPADSSMSAEDNVPTPCPIQYVTLYLGSIINSETKARQCGFLKGTNDQSPKLSPAYLNCNIRLRQVLQNSSDYFKKIHLFYCQSLSKKIHI